MGEDAKDYVDMSQVALMLMSTLEDAAVNTAGISITIPHLGR